MSAADEHVERMRRAVAEQLSPLLGVAYPGVESGSRLGGDVSGVPTLGRGDLETWHERAASTGLGQAMLGQCVLGHFDCTDPRNPNAPCLRQSCPPWDEVELVDPSVPTIKPCVLMSCSDFDVPSHAERVEWLLECAHQRISEMLAGHPQLEQDLRDWLNNYELYVAYAANEPHDASELT